MLNLRIFLLLIEILVGLLGIKGQKRDSRIALSAGRKGNSVDAELPIATYYNGERDSEMKEKKKFSYWPKFCTLPLDLFLATGEQLLLCSWLKWELCYLYQGKERQIIPGFSTGRD